MKKKSIAVLSLLIIMLLCSSVYAAFDADFQLTYNKKEVKAGDTITVTLKVLNITGTDKGVENIEGYINVDENIIEPVTSKCIKTDENGKVEIGDMKLDLQDITNATASDTVQENGVTFNSKPLSGNDAKFIIDLPTPIKTDTDTLVMNFKVKSNASVGTISKAIKYDMLVMYSGEEKTVSASGSLDITVEKSEEPTHEHKWVEDKAKSKAATCTEDGYTYYVCSVCNETKTETIKATGHKFGDWKVTKEATTTSEGQKERTCSICGEKETQAIAKLTDNNKNNNTGNTNNTTNNTANNNTTNSQNIINSSTKDKTTANKTLPAAGARRIIIPALMLIAIAYACYNKYMKYKGI